MAATGFVCLVCTGFVIMQNPPLEMGVPVLCEINKNCEIVNYPDTDSSDKISDYKGGKVSLNQQNTVDIAVNSIKQVESGIPVLAAQDGTVIYSSDGFQDNFNLDMKTDPTSAPCGNALILEHSYGWKTLYCHLKKGSIALKPGNSVLRGSKIAELGMSGISEFPHLSFAVVKDEIYYDPFTGKPINNQKAMQYLPFWRASVLNLMTYKPFQIMNSGITLEEPNLKKAKSGEANFSEFLSDASSINPWVWGFHLKKGDFIKIKFKDPYGAIVFSDSKKISENKPENFLYWKASRPSEKWKPGTYQIFMEFIRPENSLSYETYSNFLVKEPEKKLSPEELQKQKDLDIYIQQNNNFLNMLKYYEVKKSKGESASPNEKKLEEIYKYVKDRIEKNHGQKKEMLFPTMPKEK
jgi:murein DD-endopeptidase MepM/ murein hydrolase activator NlpD